MTEFGNAIAMNQKKGGSFEIISAEGGFDTTNFNQLLAGLTISDYDQEIWYGDRTTAQKMKGEQLDKVFYNPIKIFHLGKGVFN
jgi:hypothetical protein